MINRENTVSDIYLIGEIFFMETSKKKVCQVGCFSLLFSKKCSTRKKIEITVDDEESTW